MTCTLHQILF